MIALNALMAGVVAAAMAAAGQAPPGKTVFEVARKRKRPAGAPRPSDVIMRSLRLHRRGTKDPHDTFQALEDFHVTRLEWAYITDKAFIRKVRASGRLFGGAASAPSYVKRNKEPGWFERVVIVNLRGEPIIAPWKRTWKRTLWGCINNPELERGYLEYLQRYIDAGAQGMQRDEPGANLNATRWGGCFCEHCMKAFRAWLAKNATAQKRRQLGIADLKVFDYRQHLRGQSAPVGDAFGRWRGGGEMKKLFAAFQTQATIAFHQRTRKALDEYAGRRVPVSCNNGARRWGDIEMIFDWAFGELSYGHAKPDFLRNAMREAARRGRVQVVTMPKKGDYKDAQGWRRRTRQTIAMAYACGGLCMVPWDVYMPRNAPRYFGRPEQYADLFGFVRANARYLDGCEEAAIAGWGLKETRYGRLQPISIVGGPRVSAVVRAVPGRPEQPAVVHLVDWSDSPKPFRLKLEPGCFYGDRPLRLALLVPPPYDRPAHVAAEEGRNFAKLSKALPLTGDPPTGVEVPALRPWGLLVVEPAGTR